MLTSEEMDVFDEDFKHFLIANGVSNEEWLEMNSSNVDKATSLVELFSDTVMHKVMEKLKFLEHRSKSSLLVFNCTKENISLISISAKDSSNADFTTPESIHNAFVNHTEEITYFSQTKKYAKEREDEVFEMISDGCVPSSEAFWISLTKALEL